MTCEINYSLAMKGVYHIHISTGYHDDESMQHSPATEFESFDKLSYDYLENVHNL